MNLFQFAFERPAYLLLLSLLPVLWWFSYRSLSGLGRGRQLLALALRSAVLLFITLALAETQWVRIRERITALFLLDQSESVAPEQRQAAFDYVRSAVAKHSDSSQGDTAGVIVFGAEAAVERAPTLASFLPEKLESPVNPEQSNLADALRLARASFPEGSGRRIVVLSDGNQNVGDALTTARELSADGVGIDVAPLSLGATIDVVIAKVSAPTAARSGVPFDVSVVAEYRASGRHSPPPSVPGRIVVSRKREGISERVADEAVTLAPGKHVFSFRQELREPSFYTYEARFVPDQPGRERYTQNNHASSFTQVHGKGRVLCLVNAEAQDEFAGLIDALRKAEIDVTVQPTTALFSSLADLQQYDSVILADVPRTAAGSDSEGIQRFSDAQVDMLVRNTEQFGAGLVMLGGPSSFGAGGWANSELEKAMPVDFQIKNAEVAAVGALMLVIDRSGSMDGPKIDMAKAAAKAAARMLGPLDQIGVVAFDMEASDVVKLQKVGENPRRIDALINQLGAGGGTNMDPGIRRGYAALQRATASIKHMIVLTDGQTAGSGYAQLAAKMKDQGITTSAVAVGPDAAQNLMQDIAARGNGKYYKAISPKALPQIFTHETRRVVRPLVFEDAAGLTPQVASRHEILDGIGGTLPPLRGYVLTTIKDNPLVETPLLLPKPAAPNNALLAAWTFGLGRTAVFTSDAGRRWTTDWVGWEDNDKFFTQLVRWSMRPIADTGSFNIVTSQDQGKLTVTVQALTREGEYLDNLPMRGSLVGEDGSSSTELKFRQIGPGRYVGEAKIERPGSQLVAVQPAPRMGVLRTGVTTPFSAEFRETEANEGLLLSLAGLVPPGGAHGEVIRLPDDPRSWREWLGPNLFRRDLPRGRSLTDIWPLLVCIASGVFFADVLNRRLSLPVADWRRRWQAYFLHRPAAVAEDARLARLKARKQETQRELPAATRFEPQTDESSPVVVHEASSPTAVAAPPSAQPNTEGETYGDRLLRAKREARANDPRQR